MKTSILKVHIFGEIKKQTILISMNIFRHKAIVFTFLIYFSKIFLTYAQPTVAWDKTYGGSSYETLNHALKTEDDGFLLIGSTSSPGDGDVTEKGKGGDFWIVRIDSIGKKLWDKRYSSGDNAFSDVCLSAIQNTDGYLLVGEKNTGVNNWKDTPIDGHRDIWVVQIRPSGEVIWEKSYGADGEDQAFSIIKLPDGDYIIGGHTDSKPDGVNKTSEAKGKRDVWLIRIKPNGDVVWEKTYGGSGDDDYPIGLILTKDGNVVFAAGTTSSQSGDKSEKNYGIKDYWVAKIGPSNGNIIWEKGYGGEDVEEVSSILELTDGSLVVCGSSKSSDKFGNKTAPNYGDSDYWIVKLDKDGKKIWDKSFGGTKNDYAINLDQNKTGYFLVCGQSLSTPSGNKEDSLKGLFDFWILYLKDNGDLVWEKNIGGDLNDNPFKMVKFKDGSYLICGLSKSSKSFDKSENNRDPTPLDPNHPEAITDDMWVVKINCIFDLDIGNDTLVCKLSPVILSAEIPNCKNCSYRWNSGETTPSVVVNPTKTTRYKVDIVVNRGCEITDNIDVVVYPSPDSVAYIVTPPRCHDGKDGGVAIDSIIGGTPPFTLVLDTDTFRQTRFINNIKAGKYAVTLIDKKGCTLNSEVTVPNPSPFELAIVESTELPFGDSIRLWVTPNHPLDTFYWTNRSIKTLDTIVKPFDSETFGITATDTFGCSQKAVAQFTVRRNNLYFAPNIFSPNGDTNNDYYQVYGGKTVVSITEFQIFNRWGEMMYANPKIFPSLEQGNGWNGYFKGENALPGVYVFTALVTYIDNRFEYIKGSFSLVR
jgi:gliding motility-associated-like protein